MLNKPKFGRNFYFATIIISLVVLLGSIFVFPTAGLEDEKLVKVLLIRYLIVFVCLTFVIPCGCIVREICNGTYQKKMIIIKIVLICAVLIGGLLTILLTKNASFGKIITLLGALVLIYSAAPTDKGNTKNV